MTSLVTTTMKRKPTKIERLMTGLYKTHYPMLTRCLEHWIGTQADDIISHLGERLTRNPDLWDGNDDLLPHFLVRSARRLAINRLRDRRREYADCDRLADLREAGGEQQRIEVRALDHSPEDLVLAHMQEQEWRAIVQRSCDEYIGEHRGHLDRARRMAVCERRMAVWESMVGEVGGNEHARAHGVNPNTVHGCIKAIRSMIDDQKRLERTGS